MPVFVPTAACIRNSFRTSGKRHLVLTGGRGTGKSTLLSELLTTEPGIRTWAKPRQAVYLKDMCSGETAQIGIFDEALPGTENKMRLCEGPLLEVGVSALQRLAKAESPWVFIDEVGYLETQCPAYCEALRDLLEEKQVLAVVRKQELPFLQELCSREDVFLADLDNPLGNLGCVIMASGLGKRFGGNKLMADFEGEPLISRILEVTEELFARRVVVTRHKEVEALCRKRGIDVVFHELPYRSDTVRLGLEALGDVDGCMFCPGDQPWLSRETVMTLALAVANDREHIWRTAWGEDVGMPVVFPAWAFSELFTLPEGKGGGYLTKKYPEQVRLVQVRDKFELKDIDRPEDLKNRWSNDC